MTFENRLELGNIRIWDLEHACIMASETLEYSNWQMNLEKSVPLLSDVCRGKPIQKPPRHRCRRHVSIWVPSQSVGQVAASRFACPTQVSSKGGPLAPPPSSQSLFPCFPNPYFVSRICALRGFFRFRFGPVSTKNDCFKFRSAHHFVCWWSWFFFL